ncbi:MAG: polyprenyl synthetase family protein [Pirellulales bacterium]
MTTSVRGDAVEIHWQRLRVRVDSALDLALQFGEGCPIELQEAMRYSVLGSGKRLRPLLVLLAAEACGGLVEAALPAACAVELIHAYSLVHDDLPAMDDDDLRRGRPTCHKQFGEATAILVGDALQARAFELLASGIKPAERTVRCVAELARAAGATALVGGQTDDLAGLNSHATVERLQAIHRRKTGAMFVVSLRLGAIVAGATDDQLTALTEYGTHVGLAFQIIDDLLDVSGQQDVVGKRLGKDHDRRKLTYPQLLGVEASRHRVEELLDSAIRALEPIGDDADSLRGLARFIVQRDH